MMAAQTLATITIVGMCHTYASEFAELSLIAYMGQQRRGRATIGDHGCTQLPAFNTLHVYVHGTAEPCLVVPAYARGPSQESAVRARKSYWQAQSRRTYQ